MELIKVILVDDHKIVRDGIKAMTFLEKSIKIIGEASDYDSLTELLEKQLPDLIILDITLPGKTGTEIAEILKEKFPTIKILMLSANNDEDSIIEAIQAGAEGFLSKDTSREELLLAINSVCSGEGYFGEKLSKIIYKSYITYVKKNPENNTDANLSDREIEIIKLLSEGLCGKEIAEKLYISPRTVETHRANILAKLHLKNNIDLVKYAIKNNIVKL